MTYREIADSMGLSVPTIWRLVRKWNRVPAQTGQRTLAQFSDEEIADFRRWYELAYGIHQLPPANGWKLEQVAKTAGMRKGTLYAYRIKHPEVLPVGGRYPVDGRTGRPPFWIEHEEVMAFFNAIERPDLAEKYAAGPP